MAASIKCLKKFAPAYLRAPAEGLNDDRAICLGGALHDGPHLLQIVHVESRNAVPAFRCVIQQLSHTYQCHTALLLVCFLSLPDYLLSEFFILVLFTGFLSGFSLRADLVR